MTETYRFANEYGDLTHLPLFSQTTNGVPHEVPSGLDATVGSPPPATTGTAGIFQRSAMADCKVPVISLPSKSAGICSRVR